MAKKSSKKSSFKSKVKSALKKVKSNVKSVAKQVKRNIAAKKQNKAVTKQVVKKKVESVKNKVKQTVNKAKESVKKTTSKFKESAKKAVSKKTASKKTSNKKESSKKSSSNKKSFAQTIKNAIVKPVYADDGTVGANQNFPVIPKKDYGPGNWFGLPETGLTERLALKFGKTPDTQSIKNAMMAKEAGIQSVPQGPLNKFTSDAQMRTLALTIAQDPNLSEQDKVSFIQTLPMLLQSRATSAPTPQADPNKFMTPVPQVNGAEDTNIQPTQDYITDSGTPSYTDINGNGQYDAGEELYVGVDDLGKQYENAFEQGKGYLSGLEELDQEGLKARRDQILAEYGLLEGDAKNQADAAISEIDRLLTQRQELDRQARAKITNSYGEAIRNRMKNRQLEGEQLRNMYSAAGTTDSSSYLEAQAKSGREANRDVYLAQIEQAEKLGDVDKGYTTAFDDATRMKQDTQNKLSTYLSQLGLAKGEAQSDYNLGMKESGVTSTGNQYNLLSTYLDNMNSLLATKLAYQNDVDDVLASAPIYNKTKEYKPQYPLPYTPANGIPRYSPIPFA